MDQLQINQQCRWNSEIIKWIHGDRGLTDKRYICSAFQEHGSHVQWGTPVHLFQHMYFTLETKEKLQAPENQILVTIDTIWISKELKFTFLLSQVWFHLILLTTSNHFISLLFFSYTCLLVMVQMLCFKILIRGNGLCIYVTNR